MLPSRIDRKSHKQDAGKRSPGHRAFVRRHACCVCGSQVAIECAHVRDGNGGGISMKPSDRHCVSLCKPCHALQHQIGEVSFWRSAKIDPNKLAAEFVKASPHRAKVEMMP
jgi:hypothetical protein